MNTSAAAFALMLLASTGSSANLLSNGDFEGVAPNNTGEFWIGSRLGAWQSYGYTRSPTGAGDFFAQRYGNESDWRLVQFIDASGIAIGTTLTVEFDYIYNYDTRANATTPRNAFLIGIASNRNYLMYQGAGVDGTFGNLDTQVFAPDVLLGSFGLDRSPDWIRDRTFSATTGANFYAIGVVFQTSCWGPGDNPTTAEYCNNSRGFDNVSLTVTGQAPGAPEPGTLALLGLGLAGLAATRRRKQ